MRLYRVNARIVGPKIPTNLKDPVGATMRLNKMFRKIERRHKELKAAVIDLFSSIPVAAANAEPEDNYNYRYDFSSVRAAMFNESLQKLIDEILLDNTQPMNQGQMWASVEVTAAYSAGVTIAQQQLASMSSVYAERRSITDIIYSEGYLQRLAIANASTYSDWVGLSATARADLSGVIMNAIATGKNPRDVEQDIVKRVDVSESRAKNMAQTEITGTLRQSQSDEVQEAKSLLDLPAAIFWVSALLPTTRRTHAERSGNAYSPEEVADFYSRDGNRRHCHCGNTPCLLDENGKIIILQSSLDRVLNAKAAWMKTNKPSK